MHKTTPQRLRLGCRVYEVEEMTDRDRDSLGALGVCDIDHSRISIYPSDDFLQEAETLWHEVFHALFYAASVCDEVALDGTETRTIQALTSTFLSMLADNPTLLPYLDAFIRELQKRLDDNELGTDRA